jgi:hypothetical protein
VPYYGYSNDPCYGTVPVLVLGLLVDTERFSKLTQCVSGVFGLPNGVTKKMKGKQTNKNTVVQLGEYIRCTRTGYCTCTGIYLFSYLFLVCIYIYTVYIYYAIRVYNIIYFFVNVQLVPYGH